MSLADLLSAIIDRKTAPTFHPFPRLPLGMLLPQYLLHLNLVYKHLVSGARCFLFLLVSIISKGKLLIKSQNSVRRSGRPPRKNPARSRCTTNTHGDTTEVLKAVVLSALNVQPPLPLSSWSPSNRVASSSEITQSSSSSLLMHRSTSTLP